LIARGGFYVENVIGIDIQACGATSGILVTNARGERPVIQGLLWLHRPSRWTVDGIDVTWNPLNDSQQHMVKFTDGVGWSFSDAEVWGAHSYAAVYVASTLSGEPADWTISGNCIHDALPANGVNQDHLIYVNSHDTPGGVIERNILFDAANGEGVKLGGSSPSEQGPNAVVVRYNTIYRTLQNILVAGSATNNDIYRNIVDKVDLDASPLYGNIRGYQLTGRNNVAHDNLGEGANSLIYNDPGYVGIYSTGGNVFPRPPLFDSISCDGFHPKDGVALHFGRYATP